MSVIIQLFLAFMFATWVEWVVHKHILHGKRFGANKKSWWHFHWGEHHKNVRRNNYYEKDYRLSVIGNNAHRKEVLSLLLAAILLIPIFKFLPVFAIYGWFHVAMYYTIHRYSHLRPEWGKKWFRHHYDHHMNKNQHANWCVTFPVWDYIFKTRQRSLN